MNRYASLCAGAMKTLWIRFRSDGPAPGPANRGDMVGAVEQALARRARRRAVQRRLTRAGVVLAAASVVLIAGWAVSRRGSPESPPAGVAMDKAREGEAREIDRATAGRAGRTLTVLGNDVSDGDRVIAGSVIGAGAVGRLPLARGTILGPGAEVFASGDAEVRIGTAEGTTLTLERGGDLAVVEQRGAQRFSLRQGAVRAQVAKVRRGDRFVISTDDAEVEVHGTVFRVATVPADPACGDGTRTRVSVFEGVVSVRSGGSETFVPAGADWPEACPRPARIASGPVRAPRSFSAVVSQARRAQHGGLPEPGVVAFVGPNRAVAPSVPSPSVPSASTTSGARRTIIPGGPISGGTTASMLGAQNDLFGAAIAAKQQKRFPDSIRLFSRLIDTYPDGPLTEGAMVQRMKLLATVDPAGAPRAASEYLSRFPAGFARVEARRLAGAAP